MFRAHAKVNLFLDVTARRPDGYHDILSIFQEISLSDSLWLKKDRNPGLTLVSSPAIQGNILEKTWDAMDHAYGPLTGIRTVLKKRIPLGSGLGGGSSDAACFLKALRLKFRSDASDSDLERVGAEIGSDVPFFIRGGCQAVSGRGERLSPVPHKTRLFLVLVYPGFPVSTAEGYRRLDPARFGSGLEKFGRLKRGLAENDLRLVAENLYNVFEETTFTAYPALPEIVRRLKDHGALNALMSGSGSTVFGLFKDAGTARRCARRLKPVYQVVRTAEETS